jgi:hypothetical protein
LVVQNAQALLAGSLWQERNQARQDALRYNQERNEARAEVVALRTQQSAAAIRSALAPIIPLSLNCCLAHGSMHSQACLGGVPPLSRAILSHIASDWPAFADVRAAARALSQKSRLAKRRGLLNLSASRWPRTSHGQRSYVNMKWGVGRDSDIRVNRTQATRRSTQGT